MKSLKRTYGERTTKKNYCCAFFTKKDKFWKYFAWKNTKCATGCCNRNEMDQKWISKNIYVLKNVYKV